MDFKNIAAQITNVAPLLGSLLGGPVGGAAGTAIKLIADSLGVEADSASVEYELRNNPDALLKIKELEINSKVELEKLVVQQEVIRLQDVADARKRQIEHEKVTGKTDKNLYVLAWTVVFGFFGLMGLLCFRPLPVDSSGVVFMLFGALATGFGQVLQYFFGSSKSSADKTSALMKK